MRPIALAALLVMLPVAARAAEEPKNEAEEAEPRAAVDLEVVVGAGKVDALNPVLGSNLTGQLTYARELTEAVAIGVVFSGRYEVTRAFSLGARLPVAIATLAPEGDATRGTANLGNIELEAEVEGEVGKHATLFAAAAVALPTSSGTDSESDPVGADQYAVNEAVSSAYGDENSALWLGGNLGLVPIVGAHFQLDRVRIEPYAKVEALTSVRPEVERRELVELVAGGRVGVTVVRAGKTTLDVGARAWGTFTLTDHDGNGVVGVIEPELRLGVERARVTAGVLVPFTGDLADRGWVAGRLSGTVAF